MSGLHQPTRRSLSTDNRKNISRYGNSLARGSSLQNKSAYGNLHTRVFIKPRERSSQSSSTQTSAKLARRASCVAVPTGVRPSSNTRLAASLTSGRKATHIPRRSTSLHHPETRINVNATETNALVTPSVCSSKIPRSSTSVVRHVQINPNVPAALAKSVANRGVDGEVGRIIQASSICHSRKDIKPGVTRATRVSSPKNKENEPSRRQSTQSFSVASMSILGSEKRTETKRVFIQRRYSVGQAREQGRPKECFPRPRKVFLLPKVEECIQETGIRHSRPRRATVHSGTSRSVKQEKSPSLPSLPTIVMRHSPGGTEVKQLDEEGLCTPTNVSGSGSSRTEEASTSKQTPRPFLLPRKPGSLPSSSSLGSMVTLPSRVLEHTPLAVQTFCPPSESPCLSKARTKTLWTMLDEMKLIRSGGLISDAEALAPDSEARVIPLCKRIRSGDNHDGEPIILEGRSPVRSSSTPYHLIVSSARQSQVETPSALPPVPSITRALAHAQAEWENNPLEGVGKTNDTWTFVDVKKPQRRSTVSNPISSHRGYGVCIRTHDVVRKPSLLTRAQTFVKFKFPGSRKVVGRGDPHWA